MTVQSFDVASFWGQRFKKIGHTGWSDSKIYAFDQVCRLHALRSWVDSVFWTPGKALDFGCGTGDFSRLLNKRGWDVVGHDKYVVPTYRTPKFTVTTSLCDDALVGSFYLIMSITVLLHITDDLEFAETLGHFRRLLRPTGGSSFWKAHFLPNFRHRNTKCFEASRTGVAYSISRASA